MTWFEQLTGFRETSPVEVRGNIVVEGNRLISRVIGREMVWGRLETPPCGNCASVCSHPVSGAAGWVCR
jgi:hypothetical protein